MNELDTALARVVLTTPASTPSLVEAHFKLNERITVAALLEIMSARRTLIGDGAGALFFIVPGDPDWDVAALRTDYFGAEGNTLTAVAVMVESRVLNAVANMYFTLFPAQFPVKVFDNMDNARTWLRAL